MARVIFSEHELLARLDYQSTSPHTLVDVGAHIGNFSKRFGDMGWKILAFEPEPENFAGLEQKLRAFPGSMAVRKAVSDVSRQGVFYRSTEFWGIHSLRPFHPTHTDKIEMELTRLDDALAEYGVEDVTVLKVDTEGADFLALKSFPFKKTHPEVVMCEFMDERSGPHFGYTHHDVVTFMTEHGYVAYVSEWAAIVAHSKKSGGGGPFYFLQIAPYPLHHHPAWGNLIFIDESRRTMFETKVNELLVDLEKRRHASPAPPVRKPAATGSTPTRQMISPMLGQLRANARRLPGARRLWRLGRRAYHAVTERGRPSPYTNTIRPAGRTGPEGRTAVSIVVSVFNGAPSLSRCLSNIETQSFTDWECIIVDDHSEDSSLVIAQGFAEKDHRFQVVRHGNTHGAPAAAKNTGFRASTGPYVIFIEHGDVLRKDSLRSRFELLRQADEMLPSVGGVFCGDEIISKSDPSYSAASVLRMKDYVNSAPEPPFSTRSAMIRRDVVQRMGGFDESIGILAEWDFWLRCLRHGYVFLPVSRTGVAHAPRPTTTIVGNVIENIDRLHQEVARALPDTYFASDTPFAYRQPLDTYRASILKKRRVLEGIGAMEIDTDRGEAEAHARQYLDLDDFQRLKNSVHPELYIAYALVERAGQQAETIFQFLPKARDLSKRLHEGLKKPIDTPTTVQAMSTGRVLRHPGHQATVQIAFAPHKDYHVWTMEKAARILASRGVSFVFVDSTTNHRDEGARARIGESNLPWVSYNNYRLGNFRPQVVLVMNDWETQIRSLIEEAHARGSTTVGLIEGVQDFTDADIGRKRRPYRSVKQVFLSGEFDRQFFPPEVPTRVVGVPRIDELRTEPCSFPTEPLIIVNSNFSYGVLSGAREMWLESVSKACKKVGVSFVISKHPADDGDFSHYEVTDLSMYDCIRQGSVFVSRFGSGIIEALAMGKPSIYHNPHGEKVIKFGHPMGAYRTTTEVDALAEALRAEIADRTDRRPQARAFLRHHVAWDAPRPSTEVLADSLLEICGVARKSA